jgi:hypothetical protein
MKDSFRFQHHPNQEDKSGNPGYASQVRLNYSANDHLSKEKDIPQTPSRFNAIRSWIKKKLMK